MARQQARRQHRERLAGAVLAVLGVVVLVVAIVAIAEPKDNTKNTATAQPARSASTSTGSAAPTTKSSSPPATTHPSSDVTTTGPSPTRGGSSAADAVAKKTPIVVLNDTIRSGLATEAAQRFRAAGWTVSDTGNLTNDITSTCAYYDPSSAGAEQAAKALQNEFPTIKRVKQKFPELPSGPVVVVLTPDYSSN